MEEYKGIYYGDESERKYFEGGAHFKYIKLYRILEKIARERNLKERENEFYVHKRNNMSNSLNKKPMKDKKTRNIMSYLDSNKISYNTISINQNNNKNDSFNNNHHQTYISSLNKNNLKNQIKSNFSLTNPKKNIPSRNKDSFFIFKGRPNTILKGDLHKILFMRKNHLISSSMEQKEKNKNKYNMPQNNKRSLPDLKPDLNININNKISNYFNKKNSTKINKSNNNIKNNNISTVNGIQTNLSYLEMNRIGLKTERINTAGDPDEIEEISENITEFIDNKNKSQNNFNKVNYTNSLQIGKKTKAKINKKYNNETNKTKGRTRSNITSDINNKILEQFSNPKKYNDKKKDKKEIATTKTNKKKNIKNNFFIHNNTFLTKINFNSQHFIGIMKDPNKLKVEKVKSINNFANTNKKNENSKKMGKNIFNKINMNMNQLSFNKKLGKSRNSNGIENSLYTKNSLLNKDSLLNKTNKIKSNANFKNHFMTMKDIDKMSINKSNNQISFIQNNNNKKNPHINYLKNSQNYNHNISNNNLDLINKSTPKVNKKSYKNVSSSSYNVNEYSKTKLIIKPYKHINENVNGNKNALNKSNNKIGTNISNNNISDIKKSLNNNNCIYVKPKQSQCCLKKNSCNSKNVNINKVNNNNILALNYTQKPMIRKKKAIIKYKV
jgi:hypothetical protein